MAGFTAVRDLGGSGVNLSLRNAINSGRANGPRIFTAGKSIASTGGHADLTNGYRKDLASDSGPEEGVSILRRKTGRRYGSAIRKEIKP